MRPGATKVETSGSYWWLDNEAMEYLRLPKEEKPREVLEWGDERAGPLQDAVWHPMTGWCIDHPGGWVEVEPGLMIDLPTRERTWAPNARIVSGEPSDCCRHRPPAVLLIALEGDQ